MSDVIKIKVRNEVKYPRAQRLETNELGYHSGEMALYIGTDANGNTKLCSATDITKLNGHETRIAEIEKKYVTKAYVDDLVESLNERIASLSARLDALENTGE
jgi:hypothetical protein